MSIRIITADYQLPAHQHSIRHLMNAYASDPMGGGQPLPREVLEALPGALSACPNAFTLLACAGTEVIGLLTGFETLSTFRARGLINIHDVMVLPGYRRQGVGQQLFQAAEAHARARGCCKLTLEVLSGNEAAKHLYRQLGFDDYALDPAAGTALFWQKSL